jgi:hypothetical protein
MTPTFDYGLSFQGVPLKIGDLSQTTPMIFAEIPV